MIIQEDQHAKACACRHGTMDIALSHDIQTVTYLHVK